MKALRDVWGQTLVDLGHSNPNVIVIDGDMANSTKADLFANAHPERFIQGGIAEQNMVGMAAGMACDGYIPWLSTFTVFLTHRAIDPIRMLVAQTGGNVKIAGAYSGLLTGATGRTHQDIQDLAIMRAMPGMTVLSPGDQHEAAAMVRWATEYVGPVYLRLARDAAPDLFDESYDFVPGKVHTLRDGGEVVLISTGTQSTRVLAAAELLAAQGIQASVVHIGSIKPIDAAGLLATVAGARLIVTVEEHNVLGGLGGLVSEIVASAGGLAPVEKIGVEDVWGESAPNDYLLDKYGLSAEKVAERVARRLQEL